MADADESTELQLEASPSSSRLSPVLIDLTQEQEESPPYTCTIPTATRKRGRVAIAAAAATGKEKKEYSSSSQCSEPLAKKPRAARKKTSAAGVEAGCLEAIGFSTTSTPPPLPVAKNQSGAQKKVNKTRATKEEKKTAAAAATAVPAFRARCLLSIDIGIRNLAYIAANAQRDDKRLSVFWWDNVDVLKSNGCNTTKALAVPVEKLLSCLNSTLVARFGYANDGKRRPLAELVDHCDEVVRRTNSNAAAIAAAAAAASGGDQSIIPTPCERPFLSIKIEKQRKESVKNMMVMAVIYTFLERELHLQGFRENDYSISLVSSTLKFNFIERAIPKLVQQEVEDGRRPPTAAEARRMGILVSARAKGKQAAGASGAEKRLTKKEIDRLRYASNKRLAKKTLKHLVGGGDGASDCLFVAEGPFESVSQLLKDFSGKLDDVSDCQCQMLEDVSSEDISCMLTR